VTGWTEDGQSPVMEGDSPAHDEVLAIDAARRLFEHLPVERACKALLLSDTGKLAGWLGEQLGEAWAQGYRFAMAQLEAEADALYASAVTDIATLPTQAELRIGRGECPKHGRGVCVKCGHSTSTTVYLSRRGQHVCDTCDHLTSGEQV
jgi:hypothetical protein